MQDLKVCLVQADLVWEDKAANLAHLEDLLVEKQPKSDLIVLPEMFATGFSMNTVTTWSSMDGPEVVWMQRMAATHKAVVGGSLNIKEEDACYNRFLLVSNEGVIGQYDKRHLFGMAKESTYFRAGEDRLICRIGDWKVNFLICYDLRFPVWSRNDVDYDALVYVANWPDRRAYAWRQLLIARAIENQAFVLGVNRVGEDGNAIHYRGDSAVIDPMGSVLWSYEENEIVHEHFLKADTLEQIRLKLPFLADRDRYKIY